MPRGSALLRTSRLLKLEKSAGVHPRHMNSLSDESSFDSLQKKPNFPFDSTNVDFRQSEAASLIASLRSREKGGLVIIPAQTEPPSRIRSSPSSVM